MKKHIFTFSFLLLGFIFLVFFYVQSNKKSYPETTFSNEAIAFDLSFSHFLSSTKHNIQNIQQSFEDSSRITDFIYTKDFLFQLLENNPHLIAVNIIQGKNKVGIKKDGKSFVIAIDSTDKLSIVHWKRFEDGELISSWEESFEGSVNATKWFHDLRQNNNQIKWFFDVANPEQKKDSDNELFYAGYSYTNQNIDHIILLRYSRLNLLQQFKSFSKYEHLNLMIETSNSNKMDLATGITETFKNIDNEDESDNLIHRRIAHLTKFHELDSGFFNFKYNKETHWNSFKRFSKETGIHYYLLSIPNKDIVSFQKITSSSPYLLWAAILSTLIGIFLFVARKISGRNLKGGNIETVKSLLEEDENRYLEFKSSLRWDYRQEKANPELEKVIIKTIAAFGNTDGGVLLIGVDDDKNILGLENDYKTLKKPNADFFEIHLRNILHTLMGVKYVSKYLRMQFEVCNNQKEVCKIKVLPANEPLFIKTKNKNGQDEEKFYVRSGNSSHEIKSIADINDYINTRFKK